MNTMVKELIVEKRETIIQQWMEQMKQQVPESAAKITASRTAETNNEKFVQLILDHLVNNEDQDQLNDFIKRVLDFGYPLNYLTRGLQLFRRIVINTATDKMEDSKDFRIFQEIDTAIDPIFNKLVEDATKQWENTVALQKNALMELSAPLIPVMENISVMPLIGTIDTERAKLIMENLLEGVIEHRSEVVLIDITGVPIVDTMVAHHIIQAAEAVRLVGAKCILVGIRPEISQTIVNLGIELGEFPTKSTLKKGIETALGMTKRQIVYTEHASGGFQN